jgi:LacI family transcriptional regulator
VEGVAADLVEVDHERGGYLATRHLLELGHRRIACISGPHALSSSAQRAEGCRRALAEAGLELPERWHRECDFTSASGHTAMRELLAANPRPTAVFAANDLSAIGAMAAAAEEGLQVPRDMSVVGFDDIPLAEFASPGLTTVSQPKHRLGELAAQLLLERIADPALEPRRRVLRPALKTRHSTAAPRRTGGRS